MLLTKSEHRGGSTFESALTRARAFRSNDAEGYRSEFGRLVDLAAGLDKLGAPSEVSRR
jgi:hypothetical protein